MNILRFSSVSLVLTCVFRQNLIFASFSPLHIFLLYKLYKDIFFILLHFSPDSVADKDLAPSLPLALVPLPPAFRPSFAIRTLKMMFFGKARRLFHHFPPHWNSQLDSGRSCMNNSADNINPCRISIETFW